VADVWTNIVGPNRGNTGDETGLISGFAVDAAYIVQAGVSEYGVRCYNATTTKVYNIPLSWFSDGRNGTTVTGKYALACGWFMPKAWPSINFRFMSFRNYTSVMFGVYQGTTGLLTIDGSTGPANYQLVLDTSYFFEYYADAQNDSHIFKLYDGATGTLLVTLTSNTAIAAVLNCFAAVSGGAGETLDFYACGFHFQVDATNDVSHGDGTLRKVTRHDLTGNGTDTAWSQDYQSVDDIPAKTVNDANSIGTQSAADETFSIETCASAGTGANIAAVVVKTLCDESGAAVATLHGVRVRSGATVDETDSYDVSINDTLFGRCYATDPATSAAWTANGLNALEVGVGHDSAIAQWIRCCSVVVEVLCDATPPDIGIDAPAAFAGAFAPAPTVALTTHADGTPSGGGSISSLMARRTSGPSGAPPTLSVIAASSYTGSVLTEDLTPRLVAPPTFGSKLPGGFNVCECSLVCERWEALRWHRWREKRWWVNVYDSLGFCAWQGWLWVARVTDTGCDMTAYGAWRVLSSGDTPYNQWLSNDVWTTAYWTFQEDGGANYTQDAAKNIDGNMQITCGGNGDGNWGQWYLSAVWPFGGYINTVIFEVHEVPGGANAEIQIIFGTAGWAATYTVAYDSGTGVGWHTAVPDALDTYMLVAVKHITTGAGAQSGELQIRGTEILTETSRDTSAVVLDVVKKVGGVIRTSGYYIATSGVSMPHPQVFDSDQKGGDVILEMCKLGDSNGVPTYAAVWEDRYLHFGPRKSAVTWRTRLSELVPGSLTLAYADEVWMSCYGVYTKLDGTTARTSTASNATLIALYGGLNRTYPLRVECEADTDAARLAQAEQERDTFQELNAHPAVLAAFDVEGRIWDVAGNEHPLWHVRTGDILELDELKDETYDSSVCPDGRASFHLIEAVYDGAARVLHIKPEGPGADLDVLVAQASL